ncbi:MAG TPA: hypothetical protein VG265_04585, partial [Gaiellaceae bacterium]|nr:hypothetical protein [Gaiellaceae bacterium]
MPSEEPLSLRGEEPWPVLPATRHASPPPGTPAAARQPVGPAGDPSEAYRPGGGVFRLAFLLGILAIVTIGAIALGSSLKPGAGTRAGVT